MIEKLPPELFEYVCDGLQSQNDIFSLCLVSKEIYQKCLVPRDRHIRICFSPENNLKGARIPHRFTETEEGRRRLRLVRHLHFVADIHQVLWDRCPNLNATLGIGEDINLESPDDALLPLASQALKVLECIPHLSLLSFSWELGTCMPHTVCQYLKRNQTEIENLSIIGSPDCEHSSNSLRRLCDNNTGLARLKYLSCRGVADYVPLQCVGKLLELNAAGIREFVLDVRYWCRLGFAIIDELEHYAEEDADQASEEIMIPWHVFGIGESQRKVVYPSLTHLSLTVVGLNQGTVALAWAFNFLKLQSLKLVGCPGTLGILAMLSKLKSPLPLRHLELVGDPDFSVDTGDANSGLRMKYLSRFLKRLPSLEELYVLTPSRERNVYLLWRSLLLHQSGSLRRFVFHQPGAGEGMTRGYTCEEEKWKLAINEWTVEAPLVLSLPSLQSVGLREAPERLQALFASIEPRPSFAFFHLRNFATRIPYECFGPPFPGGRQPFRDNEDLNYYDYQVDKDDLHQRHKVGISDTGESDTEDWEIRHDKSLGTMDELRGRWATSLDYPWKKGGRKFKLLEKNKSLEEALMSEFSSIKPNVLRFIHWAFSDDGLPQLRVLALGDFCHGLRYDGTIRFFARAQSGRENSFRMEEIAATDGRYQSEILDHMDMLQSCPTERLFWEKDGPPRPPLSSKRHFPGRV